MKSMRSLFSAVLLASTISAHAIPDQATTATKESGIQIDETTFQRILHKADAQRLHFALFHSDSTKAHERDHATAEALYKDDPSPATRVAVELSKRQEDAPGNNSSVTTPAPPASSSSELVTLVHTSTLPVVTSPPIELSIRASSTSFTPLLSSIVSSTTLQLVTPVSLRSVGSTAVIVSSSSARISLNVPISSTTLITSVQASLSTRNPYDITVSSSSKSLNMQPSSNVLDSSHTSYTTILSSSSNQLPTSRRTVLPPLTSTVVVPGSSSQTTIIVTSSASSSITAPITSSSVPVSSTSVSSAPITTTTTSSSSETQQTSTTEQSSTTESSITSESSQNTDSGPSVVLVTSTMPDGSPVTLTSYVGAPTDSNPEEPPTASQSNGALQTPNSALISRPETLGAAIAMFALVAVM